MGCNQSSSKIKVYINSILPQERRKTSNIQLNFIPKTNEKRNKNTPKLVEGKKA